MPCTHKFYGHPFHKGGIYGLFPNWNYKTLIIGTFNPENQWKEDNDAEYFYGRAQNFMWRILPCFTVANPNPDPAIDRLNIHAQRLLLEANSIGMTDLLIRINDCDINNADHHDWISSVRDADLQNFNDFEWNTDNIMEQIQEQKVTNVYFTKLGNPVGSVQANTFENQMRIIERYCNENKILNNRLYTPSAQGLPGAPRRNALISEWHVGMDNNTFPFVHPQFDIQNFPFN